MKFIRIFLLVLIIIGLGLLITQKIWVPKLVDKIILSENKRNTPEIKLSETTRVTDPSDPDITITTNSRGTTKYYNPPYIPLKPTDEITSIHPTGPNKTFTKEDAILAAKDKGFFKGQQVETIPDMIKLSKAVKTGNGDAWFVEDDDYHASTEMCKSPGCSFSSYIRATFEMNKSTGRIVITNKCAAAIFD